MKLLSVACLAALSASNFVSAGSWFGPSDVSVNDAQKVPGDSPLQFCDKEHEQDTVHIEKVDLSPNPPVPGSALIINASGTVSETIRKGAYVKLVVKYGLIRLISTTADLCEQVENVDLKCPIEKGVLSITKSVDIPKEVPPGTYNVFADVYNDDDTPVTCLQASVTFGMGRKTADSVEFVEDL
ncbi:putative phosphatidylglycerol phosphatidylinositol transfer protein [Rosellinia necatrix]|uniref:Phosphatidylglycerol/phosphatidylinositol transfer protein n=1 Tax=Rosellinia necatrix TaxID=77044 RepID=A0A1S7UHN7_ROSNE|nr:putative phosphatidylglycerol phosphatidylinositol transfer protein [Rosellinia necatrix]